MRQDGHINTTKVFNYLEIVEREREELRKLLEIKECEIKCLKEYIQELERALDYYKSTSIMDELTNVYNRRYIIEALKKEKAFADRTGAKFALALIDIDNFKAINDRYGHEVGDKALELIAYEIQSSVREADIVGRWGGDEFIVILRNTDLNGAKKVAQRIIENVRKLRIDSLKLSVSLGLAQYEGESFKDLIKKADKALYKAKEEGKDRIFVVGN